MTFIGAALFVLIFLLMTPQCQVFFHTTAQNATSFINSWAPLSYVFLGLLLLGPMAALYLMHTWPRHVEPENPMTKYLRDSPSSDDD